MPLPNHLEFPISIDQRVELEEHQNENDDLKKRLRWLRKALDEEQETNQEMEGDLDDQETNFLEKLSIVKA